MIISLLVYVWFILQLSTFNTLQSAFIYINFR